MISSSKPNELHGPHGDMIRRIFWHCLIMETYETPTWGFFFGRLANVCNSHFHMEFELPLTGLEKLDDSIGLPDFSGPFTSEDYMTNQTMHFQEHFASQIALRRLSASFHSALGNGRYLHSAVSSFGLLF